MAPLLGPGVLDAEVDAVRARAAEVAARLARSARTLRTLGRERAVLRLLGVGGIDREGRPLAAEVVDRYVAGHPDRLATGVALPFAMALVEYDVSPQQLALDVAGGTIDLGMEAELLANAERRAQASSHVDRLMRAAVDRIDANRVARRELLAVLAEPARPWLGATLVSSDAYDAREEASELVRSGVDVVRVEVPAGRELAANLTGLGVDVAPWRAGAHRDPDPAPTGSQRGLARLRDALDQAAAGRGSYARLSIVPAALAGPEGAVVAAFERADILELDATVEIIDAGVEPKRALADFALAAALARRAGTDLLLGAGPLVVGPDLDAGLNSDAATRGGRALGVQAVSAAIATSLGLDPAKVIVGALPAWVSGESDAPVRAAAEAAVRRAVLGDHPLAFVEPGGSDPSGRWAAIAAAVMPGDGTALVLRRAPAGIAFERHAAGAHAAADVARALDAALGGRPLRDLGLAHARGMLGAAMETLDGLSERGWVAVTGRRVDAAAWGHLGGDAIADSSTAVDPILAALD